MQWQRITLEMTDQVIVGECRRTTMIFSY